MESLPLTREAAPPGSAIPPGSALPRVGRMAFIAGVFPALSETFVTRDFKALRALGWTVLSVSLHRSADDVPDESAKPMQADVVVYESRVRLLLAALKEAVTSPIRALGTLFTSLWDAAWPGEKTSMTTRLKLPFQALAGIGLAGRLRSLDVGRIHCHFAHAPTTLGMYTSRQLGVPFSFTGHANDLFQRRALLGRKLKRARFVACISEWHREFYRGIWSDDAGRYQVVRCGVETESWTPRELAPMRDGPFVLLAVGRLVSKKGIDTLIRAAAARPSGSARPWQVWVAGEGPELARWTALAEEVGVRDRVRWLGVVSNRRVRELMAEADAFVLPCRTDERGDKDGIPVVLMEAMACGLPVVVGDLPSIRELVEDGVSGRVVPPDRPDELAAAIDSLERNPDLVRRLGVAGRARVEAEFSLEVNARRLHAALTRGESP